VGKAAMIEQNMNAGFGAFCKVLRPNLDEILPNYFKYFFETSYYKNTIRHLAEGANINNLKTEHFDKLKIPLPPLPVQKKIAAILDAADLHRQKTQALIAKYDELAKSLFLEMFGDLVTNENNYPKENLRSSVSLIKDGPFGSNLKSEHYRESGIRVIRLQNIQVNYFNDSDTVYISEEHYQSLKKHTCIEGDILVATIGSPNIRACSFPNHISKAINKADCILIRPDKSKLIDVYLVHLFNSSFMLVWISNFLHGQTRIRISMGQIARLEIPIPNMKEQLLFKERIVLIEQQKQQGLSCYSNADVLFNSLLQKAFKGELIR